MPASRSVDRTPTYTNMVYSALVNSTGRLTAQKVCELTCLRIRLVMVTLNHLRKYKAVDAVLSKGHLLWSATPESDMRKYRIDEVRHEDEPRCTNSSVPSTPTSQRKVLS